MGWMWVWWAFMAVAVGALVWMAVGSWRRGGAGERGAGAGERGAGAGERGTGAGTGGAGRGESPEEILKRRYANGEIDRDSFERMLEDLRR